MMTRSKKKALPPPDDVDERGNLVGLIDYDCEEGFDRDSLNQQLLLLSRGRIQLDTKKRKHPKKKSKVLVEEVDTETEVSTKKRKRIKRRGKKQPQQSQQPTNDLGGLLMSYIISKANESMKQKSKKKPVEPNTPRSEAEFVITPSSSEEDVSEVSPQLSDDSDYVVDDEGELIDDSDDYDTASEEEALDKVDVMTEKTTTTEDSDITLGTDDTKEDEEEEEEDEEDFYDSHDEEYSELVEKYMSDNTEAGNLSYFHQLKESEKKQYLEEIKNIYSISASNVPLKFKVLNSDMDLYTKSLAIRNLDKLSEMDISTGEYNKMDQWINGLIQLPFGNYTQLPVTNEDSFEDKRNYIQQTLTNMNQAIYGHMEAKTHILQVIGKWIRNPESLGNVLAIQGPMGNGKTTLIKNGIAKSLNRPFEFVALGGASDSAFFEGHSYTYEGSRWGRIVDILHKCGSMNPIICFDELDKVSETAKGDEIINMLIHMTDSSQNTKFQDNYFPGIDIDLSKVLFIFSFNDESKINRILKDRMYVIRTKGYNNKDKLQIAHNYLLPDILTTFGYTKEDIIFTDEILTEIVKQYTGGEEGVRNLKRCIENIISTLNIYHLTKSDTKEDIVDMKIKDFKLPITLTKDHINSLLKANNTDKPPEHMYM